MKALLHYKAQPLFFLFLSTTSQAGELAAPAYVVRSARKRHTGKSLIAPYIEMPFDVHESLIAKVDETKSLSDVQSLSFLAHFGRSL